MTIIKRAKPQRLGFTIGGKRNPIYRLRQSMIYRCKNYKAYEGIKVCEEWTNDIMSFYNWAINNGWKKGLSIDRIDSNRDYEPSNCRFITVSENSKKARFENSQRGENSAVALLSDAKVLIIKQLLKLKFGAPRISKFFGVSVQAIYDIKKNKTWKHVGEYNGNNAAPK